MGVDGEQNCEHLQDQLSNAKSHLVSLNNNIRRLVGRNSKDERFYFHDSSSDFFETESTFHTFAEKDKILSDSYEFKKRKKDKQILNRLSIRSEPKTRINSRVIRELPTRQEIVEAQGVDSESRARNRRIFGSLIGTLQKFCQEESRSKQKANKKAQVEKKVEEQEIQERESLKKERDFLLNDRKKKICEIKKLELKINRIKDFEAWESSMIFLKHYICTQTKPQIYFKPRSFCKKTNKLLLGSQMTIQYMILQKKNKLCEELIELEKSLKVKENITIDSSFKNTVGNAKTTDKLRIKNDQEKNHKDNSATESPSHSSSHDQMGLSSGKNHYTNVGQGLSTPVENHTTPTTIY